MKILGFVVREVMGLCVFGRLLAVARLSQYCLPTCRIGIDNPSQPAPVSLRQCFLHALLAQDDPQFDHGGLHRQKWMEKEDKR